MAPFNTIRDDSSWNKLEITPSWSIFRTTSSWSIAKRRLPCKVSLKKFSVPESSYGEAPFWGTLKGYFPIKGYLVTLLL